MSTIRIDYSEINSAAKKARSAAGYYEDFADEMEKKVIKKLDGISGYDRKGNVGNAKTIISDKVKALRSKKKYYDSLANNLEKLADNFEKREKQVIKDVKSVATEAFELKNQSKWKAFTQWAYGTFCVDLVNWNPITRAIGNGIKSGLDWVQEKGSKVVDWFKHGEGKYWLGIALDALAVVGAVAATVGAIALAVATGGAATPLVVAAVASTIGTVMTMVDAGFSIANKVKALKIERDSGDPGQARFYGNIGGVNDATDKTDFGGKTANNVMGFVGESYDVLHTAADITAFVAGSMGTAGLTAQKVTNPTTGKVSLKTTYDPTKVKSNLKNIMKEKIGFKNKNGKWTFDIKSLVGFKEKKTGVTVKAGILEKDLITDVIGSKTWKNIKTVKKVTGYPGKIYKKVSNIETIISPDSSIYDKSKSVLKYIGGSKSNLSSPVGDFNDTILEIIDTAVDLAS